MSLILGIESTCDETAASVVEDGLRVRSSVIASQVELHQIYRGVVPEIASRAHIDGLFIGRSAWDAADYIEIVEAVTTSLESAP